MSRDVGFRIHVDSDSKSSFIEACKAEDKPLAQVLREFMRDYMENREPENASRHMQGWRA
jgi:hypothetical protein